MIGSDGLWDNMYDIKIIDVIRPFVRNSNTIPDPDLVAELIAKAAEDYSN